MSQLEPEKLTKIIAYFGLLENSGKQPREQLSRLDDLFEDAKNHISYLFDEDFVRLEHVDDGLEVIFNPDYLDHAIEIDRKRHADYGGNNEELSYIEYCPLEELRNPEPEYPDHGIQLPPIYDLALYPFGRNSKEEYTKSEIAKISTREAAEKLEDLEPARLESRDTEEGKKYRLVEDKETEEYVENLAHCIENEYSFNLRRFQQDPTSWHAAD